MRSFSFGFIWVLVSAGLVAADHWRAPDQETHLAPVTNADRFAKGLTPLPPKKSKKHRAHGHKHMNSRGGVVPVALTGKIEVYSLDGSALGYVGPEGPYGDLSLVTSPSAALIASYYPPKLSEDLADLGIRGARFKFAGFTSRESVIESSPGLPGFAFLTSIKATTGLGSIPFIADQSDDSYVAVDNDIPPVQHETTVWELDASTNFLIPHWTNPNGQMAGALELVYVRGDHDDGFVITAQLDTLEQHFVAEDPSASLSPVNFKFISADDLLPAH